MEEKTKKREKRLQKIQEHLTDAMKQVSPENADKYEIVYKQINQYENSIFGGMSEVNESQSPAYGFFLVKKSNKKDYNIMHLFREDIDSKVSNDNIKSYYQIPAFNENIKDGIEYLQKDIKKTQRKEKKK